MLSKSLESNTSEIFILMKSHFLAVLFFAVLSIPLKAQDQKAPSPSHTNPVVAPQPPTPSVSTNAAAQPTPNTLVLGSNDPSAPAPNSGMGSPGQNPPPSDPNSLIPPPQDPIPASPINTAGNEETQRQRQKTLYYTIKVKADKDDDLASLLAQADKAKSDEAKRQALREYYDLLAKRMKKLDSSLADWIDTMHAAYLRRLDQVRVEPTIPMNLPPTPSSSGGTAASSPKPAIHKKRKVNVPRPSPSPTAGTKSTATPTPNPTPPKKFLFFFQENSPTLTPSPTPVGAQKN